MIRRPYDAILLDLDGTLVDDRGRIPDGTLASLRAAHGRGVKVVIATGRSELGTLGVLEQLGLPDPAVVFNGAGVWCPQTSRLLEERTLSDRTLRRTLEAAREGGHIAIVMRAGGKWVSPLRTEAERLAVRHMEGLVECGSWDLPTERIIRVTVISEGARDSATLAAELVERIDQPMYMTHFPLNFLVAHRTSGLQVVDVQPPCRGKGEALRVLQETWDIPPGRVVAVGDATNDLPMFEGVGLAVAMAGSMPETLAAADRVIGDCNSNTIGELVDELF